MDMFKTLKGKLLYDYLKREINAFSILFKLYHNGINNCRFLGVVEDWFFLEKLSVLLAMLTIGVSLT